VSDGSFWGNYCNRKKLLGRRKDGRLKKIIPLLDVGWSKVSKS